MNPKKTTKEILQELDVIRAWTITQLENSDNKLMYKELLPVDVVRKEIEDHKKWNIEHRCHKKKCCGDCYYNGFGDALLSLSTSLGLLEEDKYIPSNDAEIKALALKESSSPKKHVDWDDEKGFVYEPRKKKGDA